MNIPRHRNATDTRRRLLEAAGDIARDAGAASLSLDAVAARAGVSKGGLLYHFPSRHALLAALVADKMTTMRRFVEDRAPGALSGEGNAIDGARAYLDLMEQNFTCGERPASGVLAAMLEDPEFMQPVCEFRDAVAAMFGRCSDPETARVVYLACEGLNLLRLTGGDPCPDGPPPQIFVTLRHLLDRACGS